MPNCRPIVVSAVAAALALVAGPAAAQATPDHALAHPIFRQYYACGEHAAGQLKYLGDALGADCVIQQLESINGRDIARAYRGDGERNEDWYGWGQDVLAPCGCEVIRVSLNEVVNQPGILGKPPASIIVFKRDDGVHFIVAHIAMPLVTAGQRVRAGDKVAVVGNNGYGRSPHIHIGAWLGEQPLQIRFDLDAMGALAKPPGS